MEKFLRYHIIRKLDAGGMATVYLANDEVLHREVALKMVHPHLMDRQETKKRFANEAQAIAKLSHDNIIKLFDYGEEDGKPFLVMEYIEGKTLAQVLADHDHLPNLVVLEIAYQIFSALCAAHEKGVCHRDVKPPNIMVDKYGTVKIMDFGIAHIINQESLTLTGTFVGSPNYISPEQAQSREISVKADVFSAGSVVYQCLTGAPPFVGENPHAVIFSIINDQPNSPCTLNNKALAAVCDLIKKCHVKDPATRPDARECMTLIEAIALELGCSLGKNRVARFFGDADAYTASEHHELFAALRGMAKRDFKKRRYVAALKDLNQAREFGFLLPEDEKIISSIGRGTTLKKAAVVLGVLAIAAIAAFAVWPVLEDMDVRLRHAVFKTPATAPADTAPARMIMQPGAGIQAAVSEPAQKPDKKVTRSSVATAMLSANRENPAGGANPVADDSYLSIKTRPPFAQVYVDGNVRGETPLTALPLVPGRHKLMLKKDKYQVVEENIVTVSHDTLALQRDLLDISP
jgi:serine/threonine-protein kinase